MVQSRHPLRLGPGTPEQWAEVQTHRGMVHYFARLYHPKASSVLEFGDLVAAGRIGALEAIQQRDPDMNSYQWKRFLGIKIRRRIQYHLEEQAVPIRVPDKPARDYIRRVRPDSRALAAAEQILNNPPTTYVDVVVDPHPPAPASDVIEDVRAAIKTLPPSEREAIEANYGIGRVPRRIRQVAADQGISPQAISIYKYRGLEKLRCKLESYSPG